MDTIKTPMHLDTKILDTFVEGCMFIGPDWTYLYMNDAAAKHGLQKKENLIGKTMFEMYPGVERTEIFAAYERCMKDRVSKIVEAPFTFQNGVTNWYELHIEPVEEGIFVVSLDITERKKTEAALRSSFENLEEVQKIAHIGNWEANLVTGDLYWSEVIFDIFGLDQKTFKPSVSAFRDAVHPNDRTLVFESEKTSEQTGIHDVIHRIIRPNGEIRFVHELAKRFNDNTGKLTMLRGTVQDITEQKKAEEALKEKERESSEAQRLGQIGSWDWDIATDTIVWTTECYLLMGFEPGTKPPQYEQHLKIYTPESAARLDAAVKKEIETGEAYELDLETSDPKNPHRWITARSETKRDASGKIIGLRGTAQDITERKKTEAVLQESEKKYRELIQKIKAAVVVHGPNTEIKICNPTAQELLGSTEDQLLGKLVNELPQQLFNEDGTAIPIEEHPVNKVFTTRQPLKNFVTRLHRPTKENDIWVLANADPIFDEKGNVEQVIVTFVDITEHKKTEEKLKELDRIKDDFLSVTAHELKSPITPIKAQAQLLLRGEYGELNEEQKEAIEMIRRNSDILNILSGEVLDISKIRSGKFNLFLENTDLHKILIDAVNDMRAFAEQKNITLLFLSISEIPEMKIDRARIRQMMIDLLNNAVKFTPENGAISVEALKKENEILISVKDSGIGISKDDMTKLFDPFFQVDSDVNRKYRGTGLGLPIARGIAEAHGGKISVESEGENKGSTFIISLPIT